MRTIAYNGLTALPVIDRTLSLKTPPRIAVQRRHAVFDIPQELCIAYAQLPAPCQVQPAHFITQTGMLRDYTTNNKMSQALAK